MDAERLRAGAGRDYLLAPAHLTNQSKRRVLDWDHNWRHDPQCRRMGLVRMACRFRSPAELPHWRLRVDGERRDLRLDLLAQLRTGSRPAGARPPTTAPRHRAGTRVVVDRELQGGPFRQPRSGPFQPSQPLDG